MIQITDMPDDAVIAFRPDRHNAVITLSHDPKLDDLTLINTLSTNAIYVNAIDNRRNTTAHHERLTTHFNLNEQALDRLHAPISLYIGSKTPAEIAVNIMTEVLTVKNNMRLPATINMTIAKREIESNV